MLYKKGKGVYIANLSNGSKTELFSAENDAAVISDEDMMNRFLNSVYVSPQGAVIYSDTYGNKEGFDIYLKDESGIDIISQVSSKRKREFYEYVKGYGGRISETVKDEEEYLGTFGSINLPEGTGLI